MLVVETIGVTKRFPGVVALDSVDLQLVEGEIHGLVGENGAGKSTLVKILTGVLKPNAGKIFVRGREVTNWNVIEASKYIAAVYQERELVPFFTGIENLFLGIELAKGPILDRKTMYRVARQLMSKYSVEVPLDVPVKELSPGQITILTVLKVLLRRPDVIAFDEASASLSFSEKRVLLQLLRELKKEGVTILYISHDLSEVIDTCDRITVLRNGKKVATVEAKSVKEKDLIELMIDKSIAQQYPKKQVQIGDIIFEAENVTFTKLGIQDVSFNIRAGEIVGFAGLIGSGRTELARAIYTGKKPDRGDMKYLGKICRVRNTADAISKGIVMVPENRRTEGLILGETVKQNLVLPSLRFLAKFGFLSEKSLNSVASSVVERLSIKISSLNQVVRTLSGGNQQKVSLGKWFNLKAKLWIFDEPTQGIDVDAKREIYEIFGEIVSHGAGVWFISSDLRELVAISDRIYVMRKGMVVYEEGRPFNQATLLKHMLGSDV